MTENDFMKAAIDKARQGIKKGQTPFGACIVKGGKIIACEHNTVWRSTDITAHAEIVAIRQACIKLGTIDLSDCTIYSTCEPCPMCFSACHWARIKKIVYGTRIADARKAGFRELTIPTSSMKQMGKSGMLIKGGFLRDESLELFRTWMANPSKRAY